MSNEEMFQTILNRMDSMETGFHGLNARMDQLETGLNNRMDKLETSLNERMDKLDDRMDKLDDRMDKLDGRMDKIDGRIDKLDDRIDKLESDMNMEFYAVRTEMDVLNKSLNKQFDMLSGKVDRLMLTMDVEGYDQINIRLDVLERGYQELKEKVI